MNYSRQQIFNQSKLFNAHVTIIGYNSITNYLCAYLTAMGFGKITLIETKKEISNFLSSAKKSSLTDFTNCLSKINSDVEFNLIKTPFHPILIDPDSFVVDTKGLLEKAYHVSSSKESFMIAKEPISSETDATFTSAMVAAIITDEIRKHVHPFENEFFLEQELVYSLSSSERFFTTAKPDLNYPMPKKRTLVVGAGGIGTFACLNLIQLGVQVDLYDADTIEDHNLTRQIFYSQDLGKNKSVTLAKKLRTSFLQLRPRNINFNRKTLYGLPYYDAIFSCVDNWETRFFLNNYASITQTPLFNASVTPFTASLEIYIPGKNSCLACRHDLEELTKQELGNASCATITNSNIITTNAFIGAMMAAEFKAMVCDYPCKFNYEFVYNSQTKTKFAFIPIQVRCQH